MREGELLLDQTRDASAGQTERDNAGQPSPNPPPGHCFDRVLIEGRDARAGPASYTPVSNEPDRSMSLPGARELPLRDVRDLALAVIEGAVAAESLAKELKKTPDRSRHFAEIAERLRSVVGRPSIRTALSDASAVNVSMTTPQQPLRLATPPELRSAAEATPARSEAAAVAPSRVELPRQSGEQFVIETDLQKDVVSPRLERIEELLKALVEAERSDHLEARLVRLEEAIGRALARRDEGERYALRTPEEAIALAARLTERLRRDPRVVVRIEP